MVCYINKGLILEQAICAILRDYFGKLHLDAKYPNFAVHVTTSHPFAALLTDQTLKVSDAFPAIVVNSLNDNKPGEFTNLPQHIDAVSIDKVFFEEIIKTTEPFIKKNGETIEKPIPGLCSVQDEETLKQIYDCIEKNGEIMGYSVRPRKEDTISFEIWTENEQLKNELYEHTDLFLRGDLYNVLANRYRFFDIAVFDDTINGNRSNNYNFDFGTCLYGSQISLRINYCVEQLVLDTEINHLSKNIIVEVYNHVAKERKFTGELEAG